MSFLPIQGFAVGAMVAAEGAGVPFDITLPNVYLLPALGMPPIGLGLRPAKTSVARVRDRIIAALGDRAWAKGLDRLNQLRRDHGLEPVDRFWDQAAHARRQCPTPARRGLRLDARFGSSTSTTSRHRTEP